MNPGNKYHMRVQIYMPAQWFGFSQAAIKENKKSAQPWLVDTQEITDSSETGLFYGRKLAYFSDNTLFFLGAAVLMALFYMAMVGKQRSMVKAHNGYI